MRNIPTFTVTEQRMFVSGSAYSAMGSPVRVKIFVDRQRKLFGLYPANETDDGAFKVNISNGNMVYLGDTVLEHPYLAAVKKAVVKREHRFFYVDYGLALNGLVHKNRVFMSMRDPESDDFTDVFPEMRTLKFIVKHTLAVLGRQARTKELMTLIECKGLPAPLVATAINMLKKDGEIRLNDDVLILVGSDGSARNTQAPTDQT